MWQFNKLVALLLCGIISVACFDNCENWSCYPPTNNLLIGRESQLKASSTCGENKRDLFCIPSQTNEKSCSFCGKNVNERGGNKLELEYDISNVVNRYNVGTRDITWWQSSPGVENVTIQFDLESEFYFTEIMISFQTSRPAAMLIERSDDFERSWKVYRYFAQNCSESFPLVPHREPAKFDEVVCESRQSDSAPYREGKVIYTVYTPSKQNPYSREVQDMLRITNLRINFTKLHTFNRSFNTSKLDYYYAINHMTIDGSCSCNGHADECLPASEVSKDKNMVVNKCKCVHNTAGYNCESCEHFYQDLPWRPGVGKTANHCKKCSCNNHSNNCHFDFNIYFMNNETRGGVCEDCQNNTTGINCEKCQPKFYRDPKLSLDHPEICKPCNCKVGGTKNQNCNPKTGQCKCKGNSYGRQCDVCKPGFWNYPMCDKTCECNGHTDKCDIKTGVCINCQDFTMGPNCEKCKVWYMGDGRPSMNKPCIPCVFNSFGSSDCNFGIDL